jgi:hypothetical protein
MKETETPRISNAPRTSNAYNYTDSGTVVAVMSGGAEWSSASPLNALGLFGSGPEFVQESDYPTIAAFRQRFALDTVKTQGMCGLEGLLSQQQKQQTNQTKSMGNANRRIVQVVIADPEPSVPLEHAVLFKSDERFTDLTDAELFFEVPMAETLKAFNEKRVKWLDKEASKRSGKDCYLEPVKIRDLRMVVVNVATF